MKQKQKEIFSLLGNFRFQNLKDRLVPLLPYLVLFIGLGFYIFSNSLNSPIKPLMPEQVITATNAIRLQNGLAPLRPNLQLSKAAYEKTFDMQQFKYFAHENPKGQQPWYWIKKNQYLFAYAGENLAINYSDADKLLKDWLDSPEHRENLLNPHYQDVGVDVREIRINNRAYTLIVQFFAAPKTLGLK